MSETTPDHAPNAGSQTDGVAQTDGVPEPVVEPAAAPATAPAETAAAVPVDTDPDMENPPSNPVSARGHINQPVTEGQAAPAVPVTPAPAPAPAPVKVTEPEPVVATDDDIAAAVARSASAEPATATPATEVPAPDAPAATAAGTATVDTASPVEAATPVIVAAEAARLQQEAPAASTAAPTPVQATTPSQAAQPAPAPGYPAAAAPIYLQRPEPPKKKSNRGFGILIALVGTVVFAVFWVLAVVVVGYLLTPSGVFLDSLTRFFLGQIAGWAPVVAFFVGMVVLIQILNRARWWAYILGGLFVALLVYFAYVGASLYDLHVWTLNPNEASVVLQRLWVAPFAVLAGVIAREMSMWTGAWLAARGRKLKARNAEAQADYEQQVADAQNQAVAAYAQPQGY